MDDLVGLVCAVLASLASGVLLGYAVCVGFFSLFRTRRAPAAQSVVAVPVANALEG